MVVCGIVLLFILFDVLTGVIEAFYKKCVNSSAIRRGLYHKGSEILALVGSFGLEKLTEYFQLGIDLPVLNVVAIYIAIMELISIMENLCDINPALFQLFRPYLEKLKAAENQGEEKGE